MGNWQVAEVHARYGYIFYLRDELERAIQALQASLAVDGGLWAGAWRQQVLNYALAEKIGQDQSARHPGEWFELQLEPQRDGALVTPILEEGQRICERLAQNLECRPDRPVVVALLPDATFLHFSRAPFGYMVPKAPSYKICLPSPRRRREGARAKALAPALTHELSHVFVHSLSAGRAPHWLDEGLAMHFAGEGSELVEWARRSRELTHDRWPSLQEVEGFFHTTDEQVQSKRGQISYAESYSAVVHLLRQYGLGPAREWLRRLGQGEAESRAFRRAVGIPLGLFEREWRTGLSARSR